jgi:hypothetical protein
MVAELSSKPIEFPADQHEPDMLPVGCVVMECSFDLMWIAKMLKAAPSGAEMSDSELLCAAEKAGTFDFWDDPREDLYNDLLNE